MKEIPSSTRIAEWDGYIDNYPSKEELIQISGENPHVTQLYIATDEDGSNAIIEGLPSNVHVNFIDKKAYAEKVNAQPVVPKWLLSEENFELVLSQEWEKIQPVTAEFVPTLNCNYRCTQCSYQEPKKELNMWMAEGDQKFSTNYSSEFHMTEESMKIIIDKLAKGGVKNILFTGGGEPFSNMAITLKGMRYAKENGLQIGLYTNGSLLTDRAIEEIMDISPLFIRVSVYGANETAFSDYTHQSPKIYDKVIQNVKKLAQKKMEKNSSTQLGLSYLLHPLTLSEVNGFSDSLTNTLSDQELAAISFCRFTPAVDYFGGPQHSQDLMTQTFEGIDKIVKPKLEEKGIEAKLYHHRLNDLNKKKTYTECRASGWYLEVGPSGDAYLCCEKLFTPEFKIGNLVDQTVDEIYSSELRKSVIEYVNQNECEVCPPLCKPHELNKIFSTASDLVHNGQEELIRKWRQDLIAHGEKNGHFAGRLNDFES